MKPDGESKAAESSFFANYKTIIFSSIMFLFVMIVIELMGAAMLNLNPDYKVLRQIFLGDSSQHIVHNQNTIGQAYLLYAPAPGFQRDGVEQHNSAGYRGPLIPLARRPNTLRVLFIGGSTTYGWKVQYPNDTYPAYVGRMLRNTLGNRFDDIEVINGGLMWGTTAELLTHYHFKYQYYQPDIVVINTAGNDSEASELKDFYHPDYSHHRSQLPAIRPLSPSSRWVLHSKLVSFVSIHIFFKDLIRHRRFDKASPPPIRWYTGLEKDNVIPEKDLAFKNNLETLIREIKVNGSEILVLPFQMKPGNRIFSEGFKIELANNQRILKETADKYELAYAPFPTDIITYSNWLDACHLNDSGSAEKAQHVFEYLLSIVDKKFPVSSEADS